MKNKFGICGTEKKYDYNRNIYKRCGPCNRKNVTRHYHNNKDICLERKKKYYQDNKEYLREYNRKRYTKIIDLQNQIKQLTEMLQAVSVA